MSVLDQYISSIAHDRVVSGQLDAFVKPRVRSTAKPPIMYLHGAGGNATEIAGGTGLESMRNLFRELAVDGYNCTAPTVTQLWGNATCNTRITNTITWNRNNLGSPNNKLVFIGASHGGACTLRYIYENPGIVDCAVLLIPLIDMEEARVNNPLGLRTAIDAAWGVTYPTPLPAGVNPAQNTASFTSTPIQIWYADDDTVCPAPGIIAFGNVVGAEMHSVGNLGHTEAALAAVNVQQVMDFITLHTS